MPERIDLFLPLPDQAELQSEGEPHLRRRVEGALGWTPGAAARVRVLRRSLDARKGHPLGYRVRVLALRMGESEEEAIDSASPLHFPTGRTPPRVVIVGSGPAGTWAALQLLRAGIRATIIEQGKPVQPRRHDLAQLQRGTLTPSSNYCFGEGGAGTYSDGKLYTRTKDRGLVDRVLADLVRFGAPVDIAIDSRPHVGSNRLPKVLTALREHLQAEGVAYRFETTFAGLRRSGGALQAVTLAGGDEIGADAVVLAVGHSARSVYQWAARDGIAMERKPIAVGVRIEHPQPVINQMQYGPAAEDPRLPAAFYELKTTAAGRGVYSFCMCPGGFIVPAATEEGGVVVNGMSLSRRDSPFANSGLVVSVAAEDYAPAGAGPLAGIEFQRGIEQAAFRAGGGGFRTAGQRLADLLANRVGDSLPATSYRPGLVATDLARIFPAPVFAALREGLTALCARHPRFLHPDAVLVAGETRTSAPVRLLRDATTLSSPGLPGLFPAGEGAGYAGGIISAAIDGARIAAALIGRFSA